MKSVSISYPNPGSSRTAIVPLGVISTGGTMMSRFQYRLLADTSPGSVKFLQRRQRHIVRPSDPRLQHPSAPHRNPGPLANVVQLLRLREPAHAPQLDIHDPARLHRDRLFGMMRRADAFIETDRRLQLCLQLRMIDDVVVLERLLDHHQMKIVELLQPRRIRSSVYAEFASAISRIEGNRSRIRRTTSTSQPGFIFILIR